jgi:hypothetical protein
MRSVALLAPALIAACSTLPAAPPVHGTVPGRICNAAGTERFIGQPGTSETGAAIMRATNSAVLRSSTPGLKKTMDCIASRVTVWLGDDRRITRIACG